MTRRNTRRRRSKIANAVIILLACGLLLWAFIPGIGPDLAQMSSTWERLGLPRLDNWLNPSVSEELKKAPQTPLIVALRELPDSTTERIPKYKRASFGPAWADTDSNGCDTRNDILRRDLKHVRFKPGTGECVVLSGTMIDPYTGKEIQFRRGPKTSEAIQIDHVVALGDAWRSGAYAWNSSQRLAYANDPLVLLAVSGSANQAKGMDAADAWLPPNSGYDCAYIARQIAIKSKYHLGVTPAERRALTRVALTCPNQPLP